MTIQLLTGKRHLARRGATWAVGILVALVGAACQSPQVSRVDNAVLAARPGAVAATGTAVPPSTEPALPTSTPVSTGGTGGVKTVVLSFPTPTLGPSQSRVLLTIPTIA